VCVWVCACECLGTGRADLRAGGEKKLSKGAVTDDFELKEMIHCCIYPLAWIGCE
jgi:hypothetical protein